MNPQITPEELLEIATPLIRFLQERGHPHMKIIVEQDGVELVEGIVGCPVKVYTKT